MTEPFAEVGWGELAERFGTPAYVYDLDWIAWRYERLESILPGGYRVFYAVKANPARAVVGRLARLGAGADVASEGELEVALDAGLPPERIVLTGPGKSDALLAAAVECSVRAIHVEGPHELERIASMARSRRRTQPVTLRINPGWGIAERTRIIGGPGAHKFGVDTRTAGRLARRCRELSGVRLVGIQVFNASNVLDGSLLADNVARVLALARRLFRRWSRPLQLVDVGGGLGIPYADDEARLDLERFVAELPDARRGEEIILEPGRWLVGPAGSYLTRVVEVKRTRGAHHVIVDGGIHHLARPALIGTPHRIEAVDARSGPLRETCVSGPLCTSLDVLHPDVRLPPLRPGDLLRVRDVGAYGFTESMPLFLSHPWPVEVGLSRGRARRLRSSPDLRRLIRSQRR